ncbi:TetR/AcrR family transcriptional regulator [Aliifodinibius salicampi]|uniref:TetR/AcrR family transcriptional regulator n=1 Tax=Fodinibius salicampi TaxID=1920655 RepID=A0ABT3Q1I5_9BACT|nr:TetR/AcrR family transcriptional regulator [Fodinibius salicampi]MCW9713980.1 TetR/AcrR family transcriptional regulator [Fodinibius salicampi]
MSPRTPQQNEEIRQQSRKQIIDAAFELFANEGYSHTSILAIARKASVSKGLIYHYFDSKESILVAIFDQMVQIGEEMLDFPDHFTSTDKIKQVLNQTFEFIETQPGLGRLMIRLALQPDTMSTLKPKIDEVQEAQMVQHAQILEDLGYENPKLEAYELGAILDGVLLGYASQGDDYPLKEMKTKIMDDYVPS